MDAECTFQVPSQKEKAVPVTVTEKGGHTYREACRHLQETGQTWTAFWWAWAKPFSALCASPEQPGLLPCGCLKVKHMDIFIRLTATSEK